MYSFIDGVVGLPQIGLTNQSNDTLPRIANGTPIQAVDPYWGGGEFVWARASAGIRAQGLVNLLTSFADGIWRTDATEAPNTASLGRTVAIAMGSFSAGQWGWFMIAGTAPVNGTASVAANTTVGITAAGQIGANSAGKQVLNAISVAPSSTTVVKANCRAIQGATVLEVPNSDGWFVGAFLSGTGIAASTAVNYIDPSGRFVTLSLATTARVAGNVTATYNGGGVHFNVVTVNRPFSQGAIT